MTQEQLWQPWLTLKGAADANIKLIQPANEWLKLTGIDEVRIKIDLQYYVANSFTFYLESGPEISGPWTTLVSYHGGSATKIDLVLSTEPKASTKVQRYVRWALDATGASGIVWEATFQLTSKCTRSRAEGLTKSDIDDETVLQPWTTMIGSGYTPQNEDIIIANDENWLDTEGLEKLYLKIQALRCCGATLVLEQAMSPEGPWTTIKAIPSTTNYTVTTANLAIDGTSPDNLERYIRWHVQSALSTWDTCFRINAKGWP